MQFPIPVLRHCPHVFPISGFLQLCSSFSIPINIFVVCLSPETGFVWSWQGRQNNGGIFPWIGQELPPLLHVPLVSRTEHPRHNPVFRVCIETQSTWRCNVRYFPFSYLVTEDFPSPSSHFLFPVCPPPINTNCCCPKTKKLL